MSQLWTILGTDGAVVCPSFVTVGPDNHPADGGAPWSDGYQAVPIAAAPDPVAEMWDGSAWVDDLDALRARRWAAIKDARSQALLTAATPWGRFDTDETSKGRITGQVASLRELAELGLPLPDSITWRMHDNSFATMSLTEFRQAALLCAQHERDVLAASWTREAALAAAGTRAAIEAVPTGDWPA